MKPKFRMVDKNKNEILYKISNHWTFWEDGSTLAGIQDYLILEQFTGLLDKNGKEIYEGDILRSHVHPDIPLYHVVEWSDKLSGWYMWNVKDVNRIGDGSIQAFVYFKNLNGCEVIGNIHEYHELLEG